MRDIQPIVHSADSHKVSFAEVLNMKLVYALCFGLLASVVAEEINPVSEFEESEETNSNVAEDVKDLGCHVPRCNRGWVCSSTSCYRFSSERVTARQALYRCKRLGANLVEIETSSENNFLRRQAFARNLPNDFWIALGDALEEKKWNWMNSWKPLGYSSWYPGEPNDLHGEDCAHMAGRFKFLWNDVPCRLRKQYVCEK